jgi:hypothetical protein
MPESALTGGGGSTPAVTRVVVVNADTDADVMELTPGATLNLAVTGPNLNLRVDTSPPIIGAVKFALDGNASFRTDASAPYSIGGDNIWDDYQPWTPGLGNHTLTVTPQTSGGTAGTPVTLAFSVINQLPAGSPVANAGTDRTVVMPAETASLTGSGSSAGGSIVTYAWHQIAGPSVAAMTGRTTTTAALDDLVQGTYQFRLTVTNNLGLTGYDDVTVHVTPAAGAPVVNAGSDQVVVLPGSSATVTGTSTDPANSLYFHLWSQLSGPSLATRIGETTKTMTVTGLVQGTYIFRLRAFSNSGLVGADDVVVTVGTAGSGADGITGFAPPVFQRTGTGPVRVSFRGVAGRSYEFQRSTTLAGWSTLQTLPAGSDGYIEFTDGNPPAGKAFYRLQAP